MWYKIEKMGQNWKNGQNWELEKIETGTKLSIRQKLDTYLENKILFDSIKKRKTSIKRCYAICICMHYQNIRI